MLVVVALVLLVGCGDSGGSGPDLTTQAQRVDQLDQQRAKQFGAADDAFRTVKPDDQRFALVLANLVKAESDFKTGLEGIAWPDGASQTKADAVVVDTDEGVLMADVQRIASGDPAAVGAWSSDLDRRIRDENKLRADLSLPKLSG
jgi:hypothetical protein